MSLFLLIGGFLGVCLGLASAIDEPFLFGPFQLTGSAALGMGLGWFFGALLGREPDSPSDGSEDSNNREQGSDGTPPERHS